MILKLLFNNIYKIIFIKTSKNTTQIKNVKISILFYDMIADMLSIKKLNPIVTELFVRCRKLNICLVFITKSYFAVPRKTLNKF